MASKISIATGNFTTAATWATVDATSFLDSENNSTNSTTAFVYSALFTPGAITIDGIAVKLANRVASPTGTVSIELFNNTDAVTVATTTINVSDISNTGGTGTYNRGWYFFKFGASQLLIAAKAYKVGFKTSVNAECALYRDATLGNWSRMLRTTTTGAPAANDQLHVMGEHTGAATGNSFTVTMDNTATTTWGPTVSGGPAEGFTVNKRGTLTFGTVASTNYYLKWQGVLGVYDGATLNVGTAGTPMPSTSSAVLEMNSVANTDTGIDANHGSTVSFYGATKTNFKTLLTASRGGYCSTNGTAVTNFAGSQPFTGLTGTININGTNRTILSVTDANNLTLTATAGTLTNVIWFHVGTANAITVVSTADWGTNDTLCFSPTTTVYTEAEKGTISTVDNGTQVTLGAGLTASHFGTAPMQGDVGNITRNIKVRGISATLGGYLDVKATATVTLYYTEFYQMGGAGQLGIVVATTTGSFDMQYCARYDSTVTSSVGVSISSASGNNITVSNNVFYNIKADWLKNVATSGVYTVSNNLFMLGGGIGTTLADHGLTLTNNIFGGASAELITITDTGVLGTWSGNTMHGFTGNVSAVRWQNAFTGSNSTLSNTTIWGASGNSNGQVRFDAFMDGLTIDGLTIFYAPTINVGFLLGCNNVLINNFTSNDAISLNSTTGIQVARVISTVNSILMTNCDFSTVSGIKTANLIDIQINGTGGFAQIIAHNCKFGGTTVVSNLNNASIGSFVGSEKNTQSTGTHLTYFPYGIVSYDAVIYDITPASERLTPNNATNRLKSGRFFAAVASGATCTPTVKVRESVSGDGSAYNGQRARLFVEKNVAAGINTDTLLATATSASNGAWESLSGATSAVTDNCILSFYVDCGGSGYTLGWVNVDTGSALPSKSTGDFTYWQNGLGVVDLGGGGNGASSAFTYA